jgi:hypothetical protein
LAEAASDRSRRLSTAAKRCVQSPQPRSLHTMDGSGNVERYPAVARIAGFSFA